MRLSFVKFIILPFIVICCATNSGQRVPDITERMAIRELPPSELEKKANTYTDEKKKTYEAYLARYLFAMTLKDTAPERACDEFLQLTGEDFWARELAQIRSQETCQHEVVIFQPGDIDLLKKKPWFRLEYLKTAYQKALKSNNELDEMRFGFELAQVTGRKKDRVDMVRRSIALAKKSNREIERIAYLQYLNQMAPRFKELPKTSEYMDVADDFRGAREFAQARKYYELIFQDIKRPFSERVKALEGIAKTHKLQLAKQENIKALFRIEKFIETAWKKKTNDRSLSTKMEEAFVNIARALWTEQQTTEAIQILERAEKLLAGKEPIEQICWLRGRIEEENGDLEKSLAWIEKGLAQRGLTPNYVETLQWQKAWILRKLNRLEEARLTFQALRDRSLSPFSRTKFSFWLARTLSQQGNTDEAQAELRELSKADPFGYYGMLAQKETHEPFVLSRYKSEGSPLPSDASEGFDRIMFTWLIDVRETEIARRYLESYLNSHPSLSRQKLADMGAVGLYNRVYGELSAMDFESRNKFISENLDFFFPRQYLDEYEKASNSSKVEKALLLAITRQESGFDPYSRSHADAFGLMQVIPEVAQAVVKGEGSKNFNYEHPEDLYVPAVNIPIGAHFLHRLLNRFDGAFVPSIGSYNASEAAIRNWIKTRYRGDSIEFIEEIPYEETKTYVKLVMRNYVFYQLLLSADEKLEFPQWCLMTVAETASVSQNETRSPNESQPDAIPSKVPSLNRFSGL